MNKIPISNFTCEDNMKLMGRFPDKYFDLAIVDPPYGINAADVFSGLSRKSGNGAANKTAFSKKDWDNSPPRPNILMNYLESVKIKLFGVQTILKIYLRLWVG